MSKPLQGITIVDMTRVLSGPFCTQILASLGARVIKVERPKTGEDSRAYPPFEEGEPIPFHAINHGKESITLDLKEAEDRKIFEKLLKKADVFIENYRPGVMKAKGYDWDTAKKINPKLVYASVSGFGQTGPYAEHACYDLVIQGMSGLMSITGHPQDKPVRVGTEVADMLSGMYAAIGINAALYKRQQTGEGSYIDVAMYDSLVSMLPSTISPASALHITPHATGNRHALLAPFDVFFTQDHPITICIGNDSLFQRLCTTLGKPALAQDERFTSNTKRVKKIEALTEEMNTILATKPSREWLDAFIENQIPAGPINTIDDMLQDEQLKARNMILKFTDGFIPEADVPGNPIKFGDVADATELQRGPHIDEHREKILKDLG